MRKRVLFVLMSAMLLTACGDSGKSISNNVSTPAVMDTHENTSTPSIKDSGSDIFTENNVKDASDNKVEISGDISIVSTALDGIKVDGSNYIIQKGGTVTISGALKDGQVIVDAGEEEVEIVLAGASITCSDAAPIYIKEAKNVKLKAKEGTYNEINDERAKRVSDDDEISETTASAAIYSTCDLDIAGKGSLVVNASYNNGIGTKDNLSVKNITLKVSSVSHALKGNDKVDIESGDIVLESTEGSGIKTSNNELNKKGELKGDINIIGGNISISAGKSGLNAISNVNIDEGELILNVANKGITADVSVNITNGTIRVVKSTEGIEGNIVNISGGNVDIYAVDDGINACNGDAYPSVNISGGYIEVETPSGDTDAVDSNGNYVQTGGVAIIKGGAATGRMAGSIDVDGQISVTGGTVLALGGICELPSEGSVNAYVDSSLKTSAGKLVVADAANNEIINISLENSFGGMWIASDKLISGIAYTMTLDNTELLSWEQTDGTMGSYNANEGIGGHGGFNQHGGGRFDGEMPEGFEGGKFDGERPEGFDGGKFDGERPEGFDGGKFDGEMPEGFEGGRFDGEMPEGFEGGRPDKQNGFKGEKADRPNWSDKETSEG